MSAEPMDREERDALVYLSHSATGQVPWEDIDRYEATVQDVEAKLADCMRRERAAVERAEAAEKTSGALRAALVVALLVNDDCTYDDLVDEGLVSQDEAEAQFSAGTVRQERPIHGEPYCVLTAASDSLYRAALAADDEARAT